MKYELEAFYLTLSTIKNFNAQVLKSILRVRGTLHGLSNAPFEDLVHAGFPVKAASEIAENDNRFAESELKLLEKINASVICFENPAYPALLKTINDPPIILYYYGDISCLNKTCVALVGARKVSRNGEEMSIKLAKDLVKAGITVVSGFAYGVDINAHRGAIESGGRTAAVLGSGLLNVYPKQHIKYIERIQEKGCILTEFPMNEQPNFYNFPKRNRIVSGLCAGTAVVEASPKSGSLITVRLAQEQGRDIFAIPVSPVAFNNATNKLIKNGATLVEDASDIIIKYNNLTVSTCKETETDNTPKLDTPEQEQIWDILLIDALTIDEIIMKTNMNYSKAASNLMHMELSGIAERGSDSRYYIKK